MRCEGRMGGDEPVRLVVPHQRKLVRQGGSLGFVISVVGDLVKAFLYRGTL